MEMKPIAFFHCDKKSPAEAARQGSLDSNAMPGEIRFLSGCQFELALEDIEGFSHLWLLYHFHHNTDWKPKVQPPRGGGDKKKGLFATRSPYRPNPIGLSCVKFIKKDQLSLWVQHFDLLDQTPIWDVKPYLAYADAFPEATLGWLGRIQEEEYEIEFSRKALEQLHFLNSHGLSQIENVIRNQLAYDPLNSQKKRVKVTSPTGSLSDSHFGLDTRSHSSSTSSRPPSSDTDTSTGGILAYRTWRAQFTIQKTKIQVTRLFSGYSKSDLLAPNDPHQDKNLHHLFNDRFNT